MELSTWSNLIKGFHQKLKKIDDKDKENKWLRNIQEKLDKFIYELEYHKDWTEAVAHIDFTFWT